MSGESKVSGALEGGSYPRIVSAEGSARGEGQNSMREDSQMLDHLLEVQRILTRNKDLKRLALLRPLNDSLQEEYLEHLESVGGAS